MEIKTLAQLKRDLTVGTKLKLIYSASMQKNVGKIRFIHTANTTGIYLNDELNTVSKGSFLAFPKANRLAYKDDVFSLYTQGQCDLTYQIIN